MMDMRQDAIRIEFIERKNKIMKRILRIAAVLVLTATTSFAEEIAKTLPAEFDWVRNFKKYDGNPIIRPQGKWAADMIFNPAAIVKDGRVGLLCRAVNLEEQTGGPNGAYQALSGHGAMMVMSSLWTRSRFCIRP